jgi:ATP-dependent protease Clp ATPase subunit
LRLIAKRAMVKNTGARGLRSILESILTEAMYEVHAPLPTLMKLLSCVYAPHAKSYVCHSFINIKF